MPQLTRLSLLWYLRLGVGFVGFVAAIGLFPALLIDNSPLAIVAFVTLFWSLVTVIVIELVRCLVMLMLFIARRTGLLTHHQ